MTKYALAHSKLYLDNCEIEGNGRLVAYNPGWQKSPTISSVMLSRFRSELGYNTAGVDSRKGRPDMGLIREVFGKDIDKNEAYRLRRPAAFAMALLFAKDKGQSLDRLTVVGHSEGGRIVTTLLAENKVNLVAEKLIVVNPVGIGKFRGVGGLAQTVFDMVTSPDDSKNTGSGHQERVVGGSIEGILTSAFCAPRIYPDFWREKEVIKSENKTLSRLGHIASLGTETHLIINDLDSVIDPNFDHSLMPAGINLHTMPGGHAALYYPETMDKITSLVKGCDSF
jgi:pimeloyl-ACP methyl ester carboxylesterase